MPSALAVLHGERRIAHDTLRELIGDFAQAAQKAGIGAGQRVAVRCAPGPDALVAQLALLDAGALVVPLPGRLAAAECAALLERCGIEWMVGAGTLQHTGRRSAPARGAVLGLLSSGSTGMPKLALVSRAQLAASLDVYRQSFALRADDRLLSLVPLEHGFGLRFVHAVLAAGGSVVLPSSHQPRLVMEEARGATLLAAGPRYLELLARRPLPGVRAVVAGGGVSSRLHAAFTPVPLWQSYGASEAGTICLNRDGFAIDGQLALGRPNPGVAVELLDGEIVARSAAVALGYDGEPGDSAIVDGAFHSGDLGRWVGDQLVFAGRRKLLIDTGAQKVDPNEVEAVLRSHPAIRDAAVIGEGSAGGQTIVAILVADAPLPLLEITEWCARELSPHKLPRRVEYRDALPRDALGKLRRDRI
ncbi:MAG: class I adenylate-forming enzyme family protein [Deltaproteobacteria bacterium]|nr:class I adenylate-forming enzyme family protein [Deltaproteobacteria bacterium]